MTEDMEEARHFTAWTIYGFFDNFTILGFAIGFLFYLNTPLAFAMLAVIPINVYLAYRMIDEVKPTFSSIRGQFSRLNSVVQENISGNRVIKAFVNENYKVDKFPIQNKTVM